MYIYAFEQSIIEWKQTKTINHLKSGVPKKLEEWS